VHTRKDHDWTIRYGVIEVCAKKRATVRYEEVNGVVGASD